MEKRLSMAHMACQNFRERNLWARPWRDRIIRSGLTGWQTRSLFLRHFCDNHACFMVKITTKMAWNGTGELLHERIFWHGASFSRAETGTPKSLGTGATLRLRPIRLHVQNCECRPSNRQHGTKNLACRAAVLAPVNGV